MRRVTALLIALIALGSMGCSAHQVVVPQAPEIVRIVPCPCPQRPELPAVNGSLPFDHQVNVEVFLERDDTFRAYIKGLEATVECYRSQVEDGHD
jgi:hypothetical protein